jgi:hypothetical protein
MSGLQALFGCRVFYLTVILKPAPQGKVQIVIQVNREGASIQTFQIKLKFQTSIQIICMAYCMVNP